MKDSLPPTTTEEALKLLESLGDAKVYAQNARNGAPDNQFGVKLGDIRVIAKSINTNHLLGLDLWSTGNLDAMLLATLIVKPKLLSENDLENMATCISYSWLADWLMTNVIRQHPSKETLRLVWMESAHPMLARAGWSLTTERVIKSPEGLDLTELLDRIENELAGAPPPAQWTMNYCLAEIGIHFTEHRQRAINIGERLGVYRDYPVSKGCTSPFAPIWIAALSAR